MGQIKESATATSRVVPTPQNIGQDRTLGSEELLRLVHELKSSSAYDLKDDVSTEQVLAELEHELQGEISAEASAAEVMKGWSGTLDSLLNQNDPGGSKAFMAEFLRWVERRKREQHPTNAAVKE